MSEELDAPPLLVLPRVLSVSVEDEPVEPELEPELMVPGLPPELSGRDELAPEPAPEPMLPELEEDDDGEDDDELPVPAFFCHFWNSDCDSEPSLLASAVLNAELSSDCIAASVCAMRPSRFASSDSKVAADAEPEPDVPEPVPMLLLWRELLLLEPMLPLPWLWELLLPWPYVLLPWLDEPEPELLWP